MCFTKNNISLSNRKRIRTVRIWDDLMTFSPRTHILHFPWCTWIPWFELPECLHSSSEHRLCVGRLDQQDFLTGPRLCRFEPLCRFLQVPPGSRGGGSLQSLDCSTTTNYTLWTHTTGRRNMTDPQLLSRHHSSAVNCSLSEFHYFSDVFSVAACFSCRWSMWSRHQFNIHENIYTTLSKGLIQINSLDRSFW